MLSFFHLLFPSWKFFDQMGSEFQLDYRVQTASTGQSEWQSFDLSIKRRPLQIFFNSRGNLKLYLKSMVERFVHQVQIIEEEEIYDEPLYRQLPVLLKIFDPKLAKVEIDAWQFRIAVLDVELTEEKLKTASSDFFIFESDWIKSDRLQAREGLAHGS